MSDEVALIVCLAILVFAARPFIGYWKGTGVDRLRRRYQAYWPYGEAALEGWLRAQMAIYIAGCLLVLGLALAILLPTVDPQTRAVLRVVGTLTGIAFVGMWVVVASIVFLNFPRQLALPSLRGQEGVLVDWWRSRRGESGTDQVRSPSRDIRRR